MTENLTRQFQPSYLSTLLVMISVLVCLALANWQNTRIAEKKALEARYETMLKTEPLNLTGFKDEEFQSLSEQEWQNVSVSGKFLEEYQFLLDSQVFQGKPGYNAIIPLKVANSEWVILVNRGWIAAGSDRQQIPTLPRLSEQQPIRGQLAKPKSAMPGFEQTSITESVQLFINIPALSDRIAAPLAPMLLQLDERALGPLPREWPKYQAKIEMHEFYVAHWLIVALLSVLLYVYFAFKAK